MQLLSIADREALLSDILNQSIAAIGRYRIYTERPLDGNLALNGNCSLCIDYLSPGYESLYGYTLEELMANPQLWSLQTHPEDWHACILPNLALACTVQGTEVRTIAAEYRIYHKNGSLRWVSESLTIRWDETANCWTVTSLAIDITQHKQTEILLEVQSRTLAQIASGEPLPQILNSLMMAIETQLDEALCSILLLDSDGKLRHGAAPHLPQTYIQAADGILPGEGAGSCGTAVFRRERVIVPDIATDSLWQNCKDVALQHHLRACWSIPILTQNGQVLGTFGVYYQDVKSPHAAELDVMALAANIAGIAIERYQFEMALRDSEAKSRAIIATIPDLMFRASRDGRYLEYFTHHRSFDILPANVDPTGQQIADFVPPEMMQRKTVAIQQALDSQTLQVYEQQIQVGDRLRYEEVRVAPSGADEVLFMIRDISERKQAEADRKRAERMLRDLVEQLESLNNELEVKVIARTSELEAQKEFLQRVIDFVPSCIFVKDTDGYMQLVNQATAELYGTTIAATLGKRVPEFASHLSSAQRDIFYLEDQAVMRTGQPLVKQDCIVTRDQQTRWYQTTLKPFVDRQGQVQGLIGNSVDITDHKLAELALQQSEVSYRRIVETAGEGIWVIGPDHRTTFANDRIAQLLGTTASAMLGRTLFDFMDEEGIRLAETYLARRQQGIEEQHDFRFKRLDGSDLWAILETTPILDADGCYQGALAMMTDITDRKRIEDQLRNLSDRLSLAIKSGAIGIWEWDLVQNVTVWDDRMCELFGILRSEFTGSTQTWLHLMHPDDRAAALASTEAALRGEKDFDTEFRIVHPDSSMRFIKAYGVVQRNQSGEPVRMIGINLDISDRKQAEEKLREANQTLAIANTELARANRLKDEFLANMSHELRTPLNAVLGLSQVLQEEAFGPLNDKQHQFVDNILSSGHHLLSLINDILDLAKIESGKFELERSPTSIHSLCETSLNVVKQQAQQKHIFLNAQLPSESQLVLLDERRMRQVLINLLSNGVKFTPDGGRVTLRVSNLSSRWLLFQVEDTGIGIAASDQNRLFQPFVQIDSSLSRHYEGTGLGLALVKQIVELHGGQVSVTSEPGKGSCFTVRIPISNILPYPPAPPFLPLPHFPTPLILLADDNQGTQELLQDYLQVNGFRVLLARNGIEALDIAQTRAPQVILMDIQMPDMDGLEAIQRLKTNPKTAMIPVIAVTASVMRGDRERCIAAGANDYLSKPVQLHQLIAKLNDWLIAI